MIGYAVKNTALEAHFHVLRYQYYRDQDCCNNKPSINCAAPQPHNCFVRVYALICGNNWTNLFRTTNGSGSESVRIRLREGRGLGNILFKYVLNSLLGEWCCFISDERVRLLQTCVVLSSYSCFGTVSLQFILLQWKYIDKTYNTNANRSQAHMGLHYTQN